MIPRREGTWGDDFRCPNDCAGSCPACECLDCVDAVDEDGPGSRCYQHDENGPPDSYYQTQLEAGLARHEAYARELVLAGRGYLQ